MHINEVIKLGQYRFHTDCGPLHKDFSPTGWCVNLKRDDDLTVYSTYDIETNIVHSLEICFPDDPNDESVYHWFVWYSDEMKDKMKQSVENGAPTYIDDRYTLIDDLEDMDPVVLKMKHM